MKKEPKLKVLRIRPLTIVHTQEKVIDIELWRIQPGLKENLSNENLKVKGESFPEFPI